MTISIHLPKKLEANLRSRARARGITLSDFVREAIVEKRRRKPLSPYERGKHLFGKYGSGRTDLSTARKTLLDEAISGKRR
jgi:RHH-type transcriptional regulator, rel operon repressor / antitoxin RelB